MTTRARPYHLNRPAIDALAAGAEHIASIDKKLQELIKMRVSQINGCAFCLDMHATEARKLGESQQRLDCLPAWGECNLFDAAERAALGWAEALTDVSHTHAPDDDYDALVPHFSEQQIVDLTLVVAMINAWNRIAIGHRTQPPHR